MRRTVKVALGTAGALGLLAAFNDWARWNVGPVPRWVNGEPHFYQWREGAIYYEAAGPRDVPPLLLLHGINAAASSYEMRHIFPGLAENYRVYLPRFARLRPVGAAWYPLLRRYLRRSVVRFCARCGSR